MNPLIHNGEVLDCTDQDGNALHAARSLHIREGAIFYTLAAAVHWLWIVDSIVMGETNRLGHSPYAEARQ